MNNVITERIRTLELWAKENLESLLTLPADVVADRIGDAVLAVDQRLGVEVANEGDDGNREVIITAFSNSALFAIVRRIVASLAGIVGWRFVALKPPRGFDFAITVCGHRLQAKNLAFVPIVDIPNGIQIIPALDIFKAVSADDQAEEIAWLIVETGVGEELSAQLEHIEFASFPSTDRQRPISELNTYLSSMLN